MRALRVGIAGLGFGLDVHLPGFRGIADVEVVGLLGRDAARASKIAEQIGLPVLIDVRAWLDLGFDAVSIALPPGHAVPVMHAAIARGLPVLAEKPLAPDARTAYELAKRVDGLASAVDFEFAELATFRKLKAIIEGGEI